MGDTCAVSILVPICNVERYLGECLESIINQTLKDLQIICIDDGSTDSSPAILQEYARRDHRIEVITKSNSGYGDSMNKGLERATGKYVGIVESDDFVSPDMFEVLFKQAERLKADVVKENFFEHYTKDPIAEDAYVQNIPLESYGEVQEFGSEDIRIAMYGRPAIWSALYRRQFLNENNIRFLPTPGASYQDTSFNFKVFARADRAVFLPTAHLHYRIDNEGSSVNSKKKADFICHEYGEVRKTAQETPGRRAWLARIVPPIQFGGYDWNLERLSEELRYPFFCRFVSEFEDFRREGWLDETAFDPMAWSKLTEMLEDKDGYYERTFGPIEVLKTCILTASSETVPHLSGAIAELTELLGEGCEILLDACDDCMGSNAEIVADLCLAYPHVFSIERSMSSRILKTVPFERLRGAVTLALSWTSPFDTVSDLVTSCIDEPNKFVECANGSTAVSYETKLLTSLDLPLSTMLMATPFYLAQCGALSWNELGRDAVRRAASVDSTVFGERSVKEYETAASAMRALSGVIDESFYYEAVCEKTLLAPLWSRFRSSFDNIPYVDRKKQAHRPSPKDMPICVYESDAAKGAFDDALENPRMTVIIPVYNDRSSIIDCLESVLLQTERSLQVICVDDGSTDDSLSVLEQFADMDERVHVVSQFNGGAGSARNTAISMARGEYLAFIDSDDAYPSNDTLETLYRAASDHDARICGGSFAVLGPNNELDHPFQGVDRAYVFTEERFRDFAEDQFDYGWIRFIYHRSLFEEAGVSFPELYWYEDPVFFTSMMGVCPRYYAVPIDVYCYYSTEKKQNWSVRQVRDLLNGIRINLAFAEEREYPLLFNTIIDRLNRAYYDAIVFAIDDDEVFEQLMLIQGAVMKSHFRGFQLLRDNDSVLSIFKELRLAAGDNAIVRLARKASHTTLYSALRQMALKLSGSL